MFEVLILIRNLENVLEFLRRKLVLLFMFKGNRVGFK